MGISDYNAVDSENKTVPPNGNPGSVAIEIGKGIHSPQGHDIQRQAIQRVMADLKNTPLLSVTAGAAGLEILADATQGDVRGYLKVPPVVADVTALRSADIDPDLEPIVFVKGSGIKPKRYVWYTGNYSASQFVTADTDGLAYVKANKYATSVGAYIFSPETHVINAVNDFGFQTGQSASTDGSTSYDNTPNMNLLYTYLNPQGGDVNFPARRGTECYFPQGTYWFKSKPVDPPCRFTFEGAGSAWTTFMRAYNEATFTNGFFNPRLSLCAGHTIQGISVIAATGSTGGRAYSNIASATEQASDITLDDFVSTTIGTGTWADYGTAIDGQLKTTGSVGIRVPTLNNLECFAGPSGSLLLRSCVAPQVTACGAYSAGGTTGKVVIDGVVAVNNYYGTFDFSNLAALDILRCETANVRAGYIVGDVVFGADAANAVIYCPHVAGNVTFTTGATNCKVYGKVSGTITGEGANGCRVIDDRVPYVIEGTATFDPTSLADGAGETTTVTVTGASLGDIAMASFSLGVAGITVTAWVSAANTVSVRFQNETGGVIDIASGTLKAWAFKK